MNAQDEEDEDYTDDEEEESEEESQEESEEEEEEEDDEEEEEEDSGKDTSRQEAMSDEEAIGKFNSIIKSMSKEERNNCIVKKMIENFKKCEKEHEKKRAKKTSRVRKKNTTTFQKLLRGNNVMNDAKYFKNKITPAEQELIIKQIEEIKNHSQIDKPYRLALLDADIPIAYKACAYRKINTLKYMEPGGGEYYKIKNWVDTFMQIPLENIKHFL